MHQLSINLESFFEVPNNLLCLIGRDGYIERISSTFEQLLGYCQEEFQSKPWIAFVHSDDQQATLAAWNQFLQGIHAPEFENRLLCKDGTCQWFAWNAFTQAEVVYVIAHNITARHQAELALQKSEADFRSFFEQPLIGMAVTSPAKGIEVVNDKLCEVLGYSREELLSLSWAEITHSDDLVLDQQWFERVLAGTIDGYSIDKRFLRSDGQIIDTIMTCRCLRDLQGNAVQFVALVQDITDRKQLEAQLRQSLEHEQELGALKTRFVSMVSHDFRNPLSTILASSDLLKKYSQRMTEERKAEHLDRIQQQVQHLTGLLDDILALNRAEAVGIEVNASWVDLEMLCHDIAAEAEELYPSHPIEYTCTCTAMFVALDEKLLRQALGNLLSNAVKYSPERKAVQLQVSCADNQIGIEVRDQGMGIPAHDLEHLFQPFYRATNVGGIAGTGLGLAIAKQAVVAQRGTVTVTSQIGVGTTFTILLPLIEQRL